MRNTVMAFLVMLGLPLATSAQTTPLTMFYNPTGWAVASNSVFASNGLPLAYNPAYDTATSSAANYVISVYGSSDLFGSLFHATQANGQTWTETTSPLGWINATVSFSAGNYSVNVAEDASGLACTRNGIAAEYDIAMTPNNYDAGTNVVSAISSAYKLHPQNVPFLNQLASLTVSGEAVLNSASQSITPATCTTNHATLFYAYTLVNRAMNQVIGYSLSLGHQCPPGPEYVSCTYETQKTATVWYKVGTMNAVTDNPVAFSSGITIIPNGGKPIASPLTSPGTVTFSSLNLLPRFEALIQNNPFHLDQNISHWQLAGPSYGTSIWGDTAINTSWYGLNPIANCIRPTCS